MRIFNAFKRKPKVERKINEYKTNIQPNITIQELAQIVFKGLRFTSDRDRDRFYDSLPDECKRHITKL
jgi:hypothetical protein